MKYIVLEQIIGDGLKREIPIIFPNALTHAIVAECMMKSEELVGAVPIAAGFLDIDTENCYGESESLKLQSRGQQDRLLIDCHDYLNGIV